MFCFVAAGLVGTEIQDLSANALEGLSSEVIPKIPANTLKVNIYILFKVLVFFSKKYILHNIYIQSGHWTGKFDFSSRSGNFANWSGKFEIAIKSGNFIILAKTCLG